MKSIIIVLLVLFVGQINAQSKVHVKGYVKKNGTYVTPHNRTKKNKTETDNWSSKPNVNPETGKKGRKHPKR